MNSPLWRLWHPQAAFLPLIWAVSCGVQAQAPAQPGFLGNTGGASVSGGGSAAAPSVALPPGVTPEMAREFMNRQSMGRLAPSSPSAAGADVTGKPRGLEKGASAEAESIDPRLAISNATTQVELPRPGTFQYFLRQATGRTVPLYGQSLFARSNTFAALESQPVPADYVVGPGDEIYLRIFGGAIEYEQRVVVDRAGMISLPKVGPVSVAGLSVAQLEPELRRQQGRVLSDFSLYVSMGALRGIEVYVVGQARAPGKYVVSSVSTLINALFATGGPSDRGTMRSIELVRNSKVITRLDLYDFISRGDKSKDVRLLPGDVINIPAAGPKVALIGSVANEAIFEIPRAPRVTFVKDLLDLAGGLPVVTSPLTASLERVEPGREKPLVVASLSLNEAGLNTPIKDGDILTLFPIKPAFENAVSLRVLGSPAVRIPIEPGSRVSSVIPSREALLTNEFWLRRFEPDAVLDDKTDRMAAIRALSRIDQINWAQATIERIRADDLSTQIVSFDLGRAILERNPVHDPVLVPGDVITIYSQKSVTVPEAKQTRLVQIEGEVNAPGIYQLVPGETLPELLARAGGLTPSAYVYGAELSRLSVREQQQKNLDLIVRQLESQLGGLSADVNLASVGADRSALQALAEQNRQMVRSQIARLRSLSPNGRIALEMDAARQRLPNLALEDGDTIRIPKPPGHVSAVGAVYNDSVLTYRQGRTLADYLSVAGISEAAERGGVFVVRANGSVLAPPPKGTFSITSDIPSSLASLELMPGDTIVVPEKFNRESGYSVFMRGLKDWTQVIYQLGLSAAAIRVLR